MPKPKKNPLPVFADITSQQAREALKIDMEKIIRNIKTSMSDQGVNQKELAFRIYSEEAHVSRMLNKTDYTNGITIRVLSRISLALNTTIGNLCQ